MNLKDFSEKVRKGVCDFLGDGTEAELKEVVKNNGVVYQAIIIMGKETVAAPTIYLDPFFSEYERGKSLGEVVREVCRIYEENRIEDEISFDFFRDYESVRGRIFQKIINYEKNKEILEEVPHIRFLDLAVVCYYAYMNDYLGRGSVQITTEHLDMWGISQEQLFADARENTANKLGPELRDMQEMVWEMLSANLERIDKDQIEDVLRHTVREIPMYVMTLRGKYFGAVCICFPEWLQAFADKFGKNVFILPSSIHELILIPDIGREEPDFLKSMVCEVNREHVSEEERLSDQVYYYRLSDQSVSIL